MSVDEALPVEPDINGRRFKETSRDLSKNPFFWKLQNEIIELEHNYEQTKLNKSKRPVIKRQVLEQLAKSKATPAFIAGLKN